MPQSPLPKLPHGQGFFDYSIINEKKYIRYRKKVNGKYISVYGRTVKECMSAMKAKETEMSNLRSDQGTFVKDGAFTCLYDGILAWLKTFKYGKVKPKTYDTLESTLNSQVKSSWLGDMRVSQITLIDIQNELNRISQEKSLSTTKKVYLLLNQYFEYYYNNDPTSNPMRNVVLPKKVQKYSLDSAGTIKDDDNIVVLSDEEIKKLTKELSKPYIPGKSGYRHGYGILFIMWVFCRLGEALALQWKDIDVDNRTINIYKEYSRIRERDNKGNYVGKYKWILTKPKSDAGIRYIPICKLAVEYIKKYKEVQGVENPNDFIFVTMQGNPITAQFLNDNLKRALINANITTKVTIHGLRHTGISYFIRHGVSDKVVSELAGHADVGITNKIYYNVIAEQKREAIKNIDDLQIM